jgi:N-acetylglucosamine-6-phosphate deacetylase
MIAAVRNLVAFTGCTVVEAVRAASTVPARAVGLAQKGRIEVGCDADLVLLDDALTVVATIVDGRVVFDRRSREGVAPTAAIHRESIDRSSNVEP